MIHPLTGDGPPLDPSSAQARRWLEEELAKSRYHTEPGLIERFVRWLFAHVPEGGGGGLPPLATAVVLTAIALVAAAVVVLVVRSTRRAGRLARAGGSVFGDEPVLSAAEYRARAGRALHDGDWASAVVDGYRALARAGVERSLLDELPGRTADEIAVDLAGFFPARADRLVTAARAFDDVRYGSLQVSEAVARAVVELDTDLEHARPALEVAGQQ